MEDGCAGRFLAAAAPFVDDTKTVNELVLEPAKKLVKAGALGIAKSATRKHLELLFALCTSQLVPLSAGEKLSGLQSVDVEFLQHCQLVNLCKKPAEKRQEELKAYAAKALAEGLDSAEKLARFLCTRGAAGLIVEAVLDELDQEGLREALETDVDGVCVLEHEAGYFNCRRFAAQLRPEVKAPLAEFCKAHMKVGSRQDFALEWFATSSKQE